MDSVAKFWLGVWGLVAGTILGIGGLSVVSDQHLYDVLVELADKGITPMDYECARVGPTQDNLRSLCDLYFLEGSY